jgi:hypothetical protein
MRHVQRDANGCLLWTGARDGEGYGSFRVDGKSVRAHRWFYRQAEAIPSGMDLDHLCHNADPSCAGGRSCRHRRCVDPAHLDPVSRATNLARSSHVVTLGERHRAKTHCPDGHPYSGANLVVKKSGARECRECRRARKVAARRSIDARA